MIDINFKEKILYINDQVVNFDYPIQKIIPFENKIIILLDSDFNLRKWGQFPNLFAYDKQGNKLWTSELPTSDTGDAYFQVRIVDKNIIASSNCSYMCIINPLNGKIIQKDFYK